MENIIIARNIKKVFTSRNLNNVVLKGIDLEIVKGEINTILGVSGGGKTTLLNILSGLEPPTSGEVIINGVNIEKYNSKQRLEFRRNNVSFIFQTYRLISNLSVKKNIELAAYLSDKPLDVIQTLKDVGLEGKENAFPTELSGGEQQRVAIARAIVKNEKLLFCDEPTGALDEKNSKNILNILKDINNKYGVTIVMITHNPSIRYMSHKTFTLNSGVIEKIELRKDSELIAPDKLVWGL